MIKKQTSDYIIKYGLIICGIGFLFIVPERLLFEGKDTLCIFKSLTGIDCPLCGMTRASYEILHMKWFSAFAYNQLSLMLPLLLILEIITDITKSELIRKVRYISWIIFGAGLLLLFVTRIIMHF